MPDSSDLNYQFSALDNISLRGEFYDDINGQRTGFATAYNNWALGWQHWLSPQVELRPEIAWYHSLNAPAFDNGTAPHLPGLNIGHAAARRVGWIHVTRRQDELITTYERLICRGP